MNTSTNWESEEEDEPDPCPICESESNPTYKVEIGHYESPDGWKSSVLRVGYFGADVLGL